MKQSYHVQLAAGAEGSGLPDMLKDLLEQNLEQNPHKVADFIKMDIAIGLTISDADIVITMVFNRGTLTIHAGLVGCPGLQIEAEADTIMNLSNVTLKWGLPYYFDETGQEILAAIKAKRLKMKGMVRHFISLIRLSRVMSVHP
jgi:hypothetical protein